MEILRSISGLFALVLIISTLLTKNIVNAGYPKHLDVLSDDVIGIKACIAVGRCKLAVMEQQLFLTASNCGPYSDCPKTIGIEEHLIKKRYGPLVHMENDILKSMPTSNIEITKSGIYSIN
jgi:hypothetical protein